MADFPTLDLKQTADAAIKTFHTFDDGVPELIPLGIPLVDAEIGGLGPASVGIVGAPTGVGKSSFVLASVLRSATPVGVISLEDPPDVWGARLLSAVSGVSSLKIRRKDLDLSQIQAIRKGRDKLAEMTHVHVSYRIGGTLEEIDEATQELSDLGCKLIWIDYIQKIRGHNANDRRNEVSSSFTRLQRSFSKRGVAGMVVSQFSRQPSDVAPGIWMLKESGDLENEARLIILGSRSRDDPELLRFRVAKSTFGGENLSWAMRRDESGTLRYLDGTDFSDLEDLL